MAKRQRGGESWKKGYTAYKAQGRHASNKIKRLRKYVAKNPKDEQAANALKRLEKEVKYTRNKPSGKAIENKEKHLRPIEAKVRRAVKNMNEYGKNWIHVPIEPEYQKVLSELLKQMMDQKIKVKGRNKSLYG